MSKYLKNYSEETHKIINNTKLTKAQRLELDKCMHKLPLHDDAKLREVFEDMCKLYLCDMSTSDIAEIYNRSIRSIQNIFKRAGIERDKFKAQSIAVKKRDYVKIRETCKKTMLDRQQEDILYGSKIEQYIRTYLSLTLNAEIKKLGGEVIVGINTLTPVGELDIPIIVIINGKYRKYGIEVDGTGYHQEGFAGGTKKQNANDAKDIDLINIGYKMFRVFTKAYYNENKQDITYKQEVKSKLNIIADEILKEVS